MSIPTQAEKEAKAQSAIKIVHDRFMSFGLLWNDIETMISLVKEAAKLEEREKTNGLEEALKKIYESSESCIEELLSLNLYFSAAQIRDVREIARSALAKEKPNATQPK